MKSYCIPSVLVERVTQCIVVVCSFAGLFSVTASVQASSLTSYLQSGFLLDDCEIVSVKISAQGCVCKIYGHQCLRMLGILHASHTLLVKAMQCQTHSTL